MHKLFALHSFLGLFFWTIEASPTWGHRNEHHSPQKPTPASSRELCRPAWRGTGLPASRFVRKMPPVTSSHAYLCKTRFSKTTKPPEANGTSHIYWLIRPPTAWRRPFSKRIRPPKGDDEGTIYIAVKLNEALGCVRWYLFEKQKLGLHGSCQGPFTRFRTAMAARAKRSHTTGAAPGGSRYPNLRAASPSKQRKIGAVLQKHIHCAFPLVSPSKRGPRVLVGVGTWLWDTGSSTLGPQSLNQSHSIRHPRLAGLQLHQKYIMRLQP